MNFNLQNLYSNSCQHISVHLLTGAINLLVYSSYSFFNYLVMLTLCDCFQMSLSSAPNPTP